MTSVSPETSIKKKPLTQKTTQKEEVQKATNSGITSESSQGEFWLGARCYTLRTGYFWKDRLEYLESLGDRGHSRHYESKKGIDLSWWDQKDKEVATDLASRYCQANLSEENTTFKVTLLGKVDEKTGCTEVSILQEQGVQKSRKLHSKKLQPLSCVYDQKNDTTCVEVPYHPNTTHLTLSSTKAECKIDYAYDTITYKRTQFDWKSFFVDCLIFIVGAPVTVPFLFFYAIYRFCKPEERKPIEG